jgi:hypothetical protein
MDNNINATKQGHIGVLVVREKFTPDTKSGSTRRDQFINRRWVLASKKVHKLGILLSINGKIGIQGAIKL